MVMMADYDDDDDRTKMTGKGEARSPPVCPSDSTSNLNGLN